MAAEGAGALKVTALNGIKVYTITGQRTAASWEPSSRRRSRRKDEEYLRRIELIQDLKFSTAATKIKITPDGDYLVASGIYPPEVRVYELREMSLKFERHLDSEIVDFQILGNDYSKIAFLCSDRSVRLHAKFGSYYSTRIPRMGRDLVYDKWSCDLLVAASSSELYRLNLEQGRFLAPLLTRSPGINVVGRSPVHGLIACGGEDGAIECFDLRQRAAVARIDAIKPIGNGDQEVTALRFDETEGLFLAAGTSCGQVLVYDLRSSAPLNIKDHMYDSPIVDIKWHENLSTSSRNLITSDRKAVRIWDPETGNGITNIEPSAGSINDVCVVRNSGLMLMAVDNAQVPIYFVPALGPAPRWCSYLENLTEEMEEGGQTTIYDDYKFVTKEDLERLNLTNLVGTNLLRAYMHGFFIDHRLYAKAKSIADPFAYEVYRQQRVKEKLDEERASRITVKRKLPKVNKELAARLLAEEGENEEQGGEKQGGKKKRGLHSDIFKDERFAALFTDKDFAINEYAGEYKALHPNESKKKASLVQEHFEEMESDADDDEQEGTSGGDFSSEEESAKPAQKKQKGQSKSAPRLYKAKDDVHAEAFRNQVSLVAERTRPLEERVLVADKTRLGSTGRWGSREVSFKIKSKETSHLSAGREQSHRRGIKSLGLKSNQPRQRNKPRSNRGRAKK